MRTQAPFVNRREERAALEAALHAAYEGRPRVQLLLGEAGVGKTRLLREFRRRARVRGFSYWYGQGHEDLHLPYRPFVEALAPSVSELARLSSNPALIRRFLEGGAADAVQDPEQAPTDRHTLFVAVSRSVIALARRVPTVLVLDDLHWADRSSVDLFEILVFALAQAAQREKIKLMLVGSSRPAEPDTRLARMLARIEREPICECLDLEGLKETHTNELIEALGVARPSHQLVTTVQTATQGNPLFVEGVLQQIEAQNALQERGGFAVSEIAAADLRLPVDVTTVIERRTRQVDDETRRLLTMAAFLGLKFDLVTLAKLSGTEESPLLDALESATDKRLVESDGGSGFRFAHPLIRHVFYNQPSDERRQRIHAQIAGYFEGLGDGSDGSGILDLAHHLIRAGSKVDASRVMTHAQTAANRAFSICAWDEAARFYEAALSAGEATGSLPEADRASLHYRTGYAYNRDFDAGPCLDHYEKAIAAFRGLGDRAGLVRALQEKTRAAYTFGSISYGKLADVEPLERALKELGEAEPQLRGMVLDALANAYWTARDQDKARELAERAIEIGNQIGDNALCAKAHGTLALTKLQTLHLREALEISKLGLAHARESGDLKLVEQRILRMPLWLFWLGRLDESEETAREASTLEEMTHDWGESSLSIAASVSLDVARGDFEAAERHAREVMERVHRSRYPWAAPIALFSLACARALRGARAEAEDALDTLMQPGRVFEDPSPFRSTVQLYRELARVYADPTQRRELDVHSTRRARPEGFDISVLGPLCAEVELVDPDANVIEIDAAYDALSLARERGVVFPYGWVFLVPRVLGVAAALDGRLDVAEDHFRSAIETAEAEGARPELGRACLDWADVLMARDAEGDRERAAELVDRADSIFAEFRMEPFRERAMQSATALGITLTSPLGIPSADELSFRDVAVLDQIARGRSDAAIADDLLLSRDTVARQVEAVFEKIEVEGRTGAAAYALERGLAPGLAGVREPLADYDEDARASEPLVLVVSDIEGSTALMERIGDEGARDLLHTHNLIVRACIHDHSGSEIQQTGDGFLMYFHSATQALECAVSIQRSMARYNHDHGDCPLRIRIGIHSGRPLPDEGRLVGVAVNTAARICSVAVSGEILVSDLVRQLAPGPGFAYFDHGVAELKGRSEPFHLFRLGWE